MCFFTIYEPPQVGFVGMKTTVPSSTTLTHKRVRGAFMCIHFIPEWLRMDLSESFKVQRKRWVKHLSLQRTFGLNLEKKIEINDLESTDAMFD